MNKTTRKARKPPRKAKRETARDLRGKLETLQANHQRLLDKEKARDNALREFAEMLRPFAQQGKNVDRERVPGDHLWFVPRWDLWFKMPAHERRIYMANGVP